jgi:hypothetical protein
VWGGGEGSVSVRDIATSSILSIEIFVHVRSPTLHADSLGQDKYDITTVIQLILYMYIPEQGGGTRRGSEE